MLVSPNLTMIGLYNYDNTLFEGLTFPAGINKDTAVTEILMKCGEFTVLYADPNFMKDAITHWGTKHYRTFEQWVKALSIEFDPLYNYDRFEEYTDEKIAKGQNKTSSEEMQNGLNQNTLSKSEESKDNAHSITQTSTDSSSSDTDTRSVAAYDSATYTPREQETKSNTSGQTGNGIASNDSKTESEGKETANGMSQNSTKGSTESQSNNLEQNKHTAHLYGNIGVTTSTKMLEDFLKVERFTIYEEIADIFVSEFCIMVY